MLRFAGIIMIKGDRDSKAEAIPFKRRGMRKLMADRK